MTKKSNIALLLLATSALASPAFADSPAPPFVSVDDHGVDLISGMPFFAVEEGGIGSGPGRITMQRIWTAHARFQDNWTGGLSNVSNATTKMYVQWAGISDSFSGSGPNWTSDKGDGATLTVDAQGYWTYTSRDGTKITFSQTTVYNGPYCPGGDPLQCRVPISITAPTGMRFNLSWEEITLFNVKYRRLTGITSSAGYSAAIAYVTNNPGTGPSLDGNWMKRSLITFNNTATPLSPAPTISYAYPSATTVDVTDAAGRTWHWEQDSNGRLTGLRRPGSTANNISYFYTAGSGLTSATKDGVTNSYSRTTTGSTPIVTITDPLNQQKFVTVDSAISRVTQFQNAANKIWSYQYDSSSRLTRITEPEGNYVQYAYDSRGNVTTRTNVAKVGSSLSNIVTSASFDATCANVVKCNKPNSITDARGNVTNYTYDATHGGLLTVTRPAPAAGGIRPQTRYSYSQITSASGDLVYMLTGASACQTTGSCSGSADEAKATIAYNSNLLPTSATRGNGSGTLTAAITATYDARGNVDTVDGPLAGTADTTKYRYDAADQVVGVTSPDPDGAGAMKMRATRLTYRPDGQVSRQELGTVNSQSDPDWTLFAPLQTVDVAFDTNSRPTQQKLSAGGTNYALTQTSYDALGRVDCSAVRMNVAVYGSLPASACTLSTQGADGPDRIGKIAYDVVGRVNQVQEGVGTSDAATERTLTYTDNGLVSTLKDAENNLTTYEYDGFDRLAGTRFPNLTKGSGTSSPTASEQLAYDANSNVTSWKSITFSYDNLDRVTLKNLPGTEPDVTYIYDNFDRLTSASQTGNALSFTYDALSRKLTETGPQGTVTSAWDLAGRRTQLTYPGTGLFVNYDYLVTGEVTNVRENGATSGVGMLATYAYDDLGNRTSVTFGNGVMQGYTYDPVSRLGSLTNDLSGTVNDLSATFAYNPASQIKSTTRTGDAYSFTGLANQSTASTANGLNQETTVAGTTAYWDGGGNLASDPVSGKIYGYSSENLLTSLGWPQSTVGLGYDPLKRLYQVAGAGTTRFAYDGVNALAEYDGSNALQRRYVFGPGTDDPIVQYEGTGTTDRRFMGKDERGSIISLTDSAGALIALNRYDEYGKPQSSNTGRFQYTGQMWLSELGAYYYKARVYLPHLGIFAQRDPVGYDGDGPNLYAYVGNDPVNRADPLGLQCNPAQSIGGCGDVTVTGTRTSSQGMSPPMDSPSPPVTVPSHMAACNECDGSPEDIVIRAPRLSPTPPPEGDIVVTAPRIASRTPAPAGHRLAFVQARSPARRPPYDPNTNYCGAEGGQQFPSGTWNGACAAHDDCYAQQQRKTSCDARLGVDVTIQCMAGIPSPLPAAAACGVVGIIYGGAVYFRGQPAYDRAK